MEWSESLMGQWVIVTKKLIRDKEKNLGFYDVEWWSEDFPPQEGMIVGRRWLKNGKLFPGYSSREDYQPGVLKNIVSVPCVLVLFDSRYNPEYVPFDGFEITGEKHEQ